MWQALVIFGPGSLWLVLNCIGMVKQMIHKLELHRQVMQDYSRKEMQDDSRRATQNDSRHDVPTQGDE